MPQNDKASKSSVAVPSHHLETYARKKPTERRGGPNGRPLDAKLVTALPGLVRNIEAIVAGRAAQSGTFMRLKEMKEVGSREVEEKRAKAGGQRVNGVKAVNKVLEKARNAKGVRGGFDVEELAELAPELKDLIAAAGGGDKSAKSSNAAARGPGAIGGGAGAGAGGGSGVVVGPTHGKRQLEGAGAGAGASATSSAAAVAKKSRQAEEAEKMRRRKAAVGAGGAGGGAAAAAGAGGASLFRDDAEVAAEFGADFV